MATQAVSPRLRPQFGSRLRPRVLPQHPLAQAVAGVLMAAVAGALTVYQNSHRVLDAVVVMIVVAGTGWFATTRRPAFALALLMLYLGLLDGYLKLSTNSNYVTFVRDALLFALAAGVLVRAVVVRQELRLPPLGVWVVAFIVIVLGELANPNNGSLYHSLAGARQHLEFVPLFFLTYTFVRSTKALRVYVVLLVAIGAINGVVDVVQYNESPAQLATWGPGYSKRVLGTQNFSFAGRAFYNAQGQEQTRPFGLGSDSGDGGLMAAMAIGGIIALASTRRGRRYLPFLLLAGVCAVAGIVTAQGRAVIVCAFAVVLGYALLVVTSRSGFRAILGLCVALAVAFAAYQIVAPSASSLRTSQLTLGNLLSAAAHNRGSTYGEIPKDILHHPFGDGLGVAGPAVGTKGAPPQVGTLSAETEANFDLLETGVPGLIVLFGFPLRLLVLALRRCRLVADQEARLLLAASIAPLVGMLAIYTVSAVTPTTPYGPYLWAEGGIMAYWLIVRPSLGGRGTASSVDAGDIAVSFG